MQINRNELDRYITGNYGEDQFRGMEDEPEEEIENCRSICCNAEVSSTLHPYCMNCGAEIEREK